MSESVRSTKTKPDTPAEEAIDVKKLAELGFVLEITARDPDVRDTRGTLIEVGGIFDHWHHPCSNKDKIDGICKHKDTPAGEWKKIPAADEKRCIN